jgi:4-diphosphocytidyl-2-C-methyl-D-erythritol kinase
MQELFVGLPDGGQAETIASKLGSDINFCLRGGTQLGTGRGDKLEPLEKAREIYFLVVKPRHLSISTAWIYQEFDKHNPVHSMPEATSYNASSLCSNALAKGQLDEIAGSIFNSFERIVCDRYPEIAALQALMIRAGCLNANITGSGPTLFGLIPSLEAGLIAQNLLLTDSAYIANDALASDSWITRSTPRGLVLLAENSR